MQTYLKCLRSVGIDEVGRGPLAGPVVAACVYTPENVEIPDDLPVIKDSKKMTHKNRQKVVKWVEEHNEIRFSIAEASVEEIDTLNILQATFLAMKRAFDSLEKDLNFVDCAIFVDGNKIPQLGKSNVECIVGGDNKILSISLASIIAKEYRDDLMAKIGQKYPEYDFAKNVGYGTKKHMQAINEFGPTEYHRKSFEPVKSLVKFA